MKYRTTALLVVTLLTVAAADRATRPATSPVATEDGISVHFSPNGGCTDAIVARIGQARHVIDLQAYSFTSTAIAKAMAEAQARGVKVRAVLDRSNETGKYSGATYLINHGIPVWIDKKHAIAHNKIIIIDGYTIIGGSFNYSGAAETSNAENVTIIEGKIKLVDAYEDNFETHLQHSEPYMPPAVPK